MNDPLLIATAIGTGIAIAQPWVIALWKKYVRKGSVAPYATGFIEIGYSQFGPTLAIDGTLRTLYQDVFIDSIDLILTKHQDKSQHEFNWLVFRPYSYSLGANVGETRYETAAGLMITPNAPKRICIVFSDSKTRERMEEHLVLASNTYWEIRNSEEFQSLDRRYALPEEQVNVLMGQIDERYHDHGIQVDCFSNLDRIYYWEPGEYEIEMRVKSSHPQQLFSKKWSFRITDDQSRHLRMNVIKLLNLPMFSDLGIADPSPFHFIYCSYIGEA